MSIFTTDEKIDRIIEILNKNNTALTSPDDILIQYPMSAAEMLIPANTTVTPVNRRINRKLKTVTVSIPQNCILTLENNNITQMFFSNESGTLEFPVGIYFEETVISITNTGNTPAQCSFRCIFSQR